MTTKTSATTRPDVYARITNRIIDDLERGVRPWLNPWSAANTAGRITRPLRHNGQPYSGINVVLLWSEAVARGFVSPIWMTFRQALALGGHVRKGETGSTVVYANRVTKTERDDNGDEVEREISFLRAYTVFCVDQIDCLPDHYHTKVEPILDPVTRIDRADAFYAATRADIHHGGTQAYYALVSDHVQMPPFETFHDAEAYYATLGHELVHWTRHGSRLDRDFGRKRWGDEGYAREELVAELGAAFLCADLGITPEPRVDHAAYIASWLKVLRNDERFIFSAAAHAQRGVDFLHRLQPQADSQDRAVA